MTKKKKKRPTFNSNKSGTLISNPETVSAIVGSIKRTFSRSPMIRDFLNKYRREEQWFKKDGTLAKKPKVFYKCFKCQQEFNSAQVQVDHIEPVVPVNIPAKHLSYDTLIDRLFCEESNLQILCKNHHKEKSQQENTLRKEWLTRVKYIVYQTVNKINKKKYIGIHKCIDYDDGYMGSGTAFKYALSKYGKDSFYRHILHVYDNLDDAAIKERELVNDTVIRSDEYYNLVIGGKIGEFTVNNSNKIKVICHETGQIFESITAAADVIDISISSIVKVLDKLDSVANNLHFFTLSTYNSDIKVTYPSAGKSVICFNNKRQYSSLVKCAEDLSLDYKTLRNAMLLRNEDGVSSLNNYYFIYEEDYDPSIAYAITSEQIRCIELNLLFPNGVEAGRYLKHKKPDFAGIAIGRAVRQGCPMYGYHWEKYVTKVELPKIPLSVTTHDQLIPRYDNGQIITDSKDIEKWHKLNDEPPKRRKHLKESENR